MQLRVYGPGCPNCHRLERNVHEALRGLGQSVEVRKVTDITDIADAGVMRTPALGIDDHLLLQGRVPVVAELTTILADALERSTPQAE